jgi:hypothetical protein
LDDDLADFAKGLEEEPVSPPPQKKEKPKPPEDEPKPTEGEPKPPEEPQSEDDDYLGVPKPKEKPKSPEGEPKPPEEPPTGPLKAPELRAAYAKVKEELANTRKELESLKTGGKPIQDDERKTYSQEIEKLKSQLEEVNTSLKSVAYEQSTEYKEKYEQPFVDAWNEGVQMVSELNVQDQDGNARKGTPDDFAAIMRIPDNEQAATLAQELFGQNAFYVLAQRRDIQKLHFQRVKAIEQFRSTLSEREKALAEQNKKQAEEREQHRMQAVTLFKKYNAEATEKYPQFFAPIDGDEEGNDLLARGYRDADLAFSGSPDLPLEKRVRLHSAIRNRAAAFSRLVHQLKGKDAEIESLKAELEEIRGSTPGAGQEGREQQHQKRLTADEEIEAVAMRTTPR